LRNIYKILVGKPDGNMPLGKLRRRWKDEINTQFEYLKNACILLGGESLEKRPTEDERVRETLLSSLQSPDYFMEI
jgi:hypothetical protein